LALLQRVRILPNERLDLPDFNNIEGFVCADFQAIHRNIWSKENLVISGFVATGTGGSELSVVLAGSVSIYGNDDGNLFIGASSLSPLTTSSLTPSATNFVELVLSQDTGGADSRAFWDQTASGGQGAEFSQIVDTFIFTKSTFVINTSNFSGDTDKLKVCEVDVDGTGTITEIRDSREMFYRLGRPSDTTKVFPWVSRTEPVATDFTGADKDITTMKEWQDAVMDRIKENSGTTFWYETPSISLVGLFLNTALSTLVDLTGSAKFGWDGTDLSITDGNGGPADADKLASLRMFSNSFDFEFTRQDGTGGSSKITIADGEVVWAQLPDPLANTVYTGVGVIATNYQVTARGSVPQKDTTFWLAYREGTKLYLRGLGELEAGEEREINDETPQDILTYLGISNETISAPVYVNPLILNQGQNITSAVDRMDKSAALVNTKLTGGGTFSWDLTNTELTFTSDAFVSVPGLNNVRNTIPTSESPITLAANEVAYVDLNRTTGAAANLTVNTANINALTLTQDRIIIARRDGSDILVGNNCFRLKDGEFLELDAALAEINRRLGQLELNAHESDVSNARIDSSDKAMLDGRTLAQEIDELILDFDGAVIEFNTGSIFKADGSTPLGANFTPFTIPVGEYFWYGIGLNATTSTGINKTNAQIEVTEALSANVVQASAPFPSISGTKKLGAVQVRNIGGTITLVDIYRLPSSGSAGGNVGYAKIFLSM